MRLLEEHLEPEPLVAHFRCPIDRAFVHNLTADVPASELSTIPDPHETFFNSRIVFDGVAQWSRREWWKEKGADDARSLRRLETLRRNSRAYCGRQKAKKAGGAL